MPGDGRAKRIVMLGTSPRTMGGIASVVRVYDESGLLGRYGVHYLATHRDGGYAAKLSIHGRALLAFVVLLARRRVGLVHVHVSSHASFWRKLTFLAPAMVFQVPFVLHLHGSDFATFFEDDCGPWRRRVVRRVFDRAACVVVLSESWQTWVRGVSANPWVEVIHNPVVLPDSSDPQDREDARVLALGRLGHRKGTYDLLEAVGRLTSSGHRVRLRLAGDGELEATASRAAELGVQIDLLGWIGPEARADELRRATVFALPSYAEGLPMGLLEAMAAGVPAVVTPVGGIPDAVTDGVEGFLVAPGDVDALTDRLARLLEDSALAAAMGKDARTKAESFSAEVTLAKVEAIYRRFGFVAS